MKSNIMSLYPVVYQEVQQTKALAGAEDMLFDKWFAEMQMARDNQFLSEANEIGIAAREKLYQIKADPAESLEFRRQRLRTRMLMKPPFTFRYLRERLDDMIGAGQYNMWMSAGEYNYYLGSCRLGEKPFREYTHTLNIEAVVADAAWYHEVQVFIGTIKPANIVYALYPLLSNGISMGETVINTGIRWNHRLDGSWRLGERPFQRLGEDKEVKMAKDNSLQQVFLEDHAQFSAQSIAKVLLNDTVEITSFLHRDTDGTQANLRYVVPDDSGLTRINNIKLLDGEDRVLSSSNVYIPLTDLVTLQHTISHREGTVDV